MKFPLRILHTSQNRHKIKSLIQLTTLYSQTQIIEQTSYITQAIQTIQLILITPLLIILNKIQQKMKLIQFLQVRYMVKETYHYSLYKRFI